MFQAPLLLHPRLDAKPWGGARLASYGFALDAGPEPLGEALLSHGDSLVELSHGDLIKLSTLSFIDPGSFVGPMGPGVTGERDLFPLLVKFIDGMDDLSIQVHPDDLLARELGEPTGKTEAWHVLAAEPGAVLYLGIADGVDPAAFFAAAQSGDPATASMLRTVPAIPGMTVLLPAGAIHAIGRGVLLYEI
ncbi:MAG: class I mannose-6-phosphate isomerase, partial [Thermomicrobiales bacterium]